ALADQSFRFIINSRRKPPRFPFRFRTLPIRQSLSSGLKLPFLPWLKIRIRMWRFLRPHLPILRLRSVQESRRLRSASAAPRVHHLQFAKRTISPRVTRRRCPESRSPLLRVNSSCRLLQSPECRVCLLRRRQSLPYERRSRKLNPGGGSSP